MLLRIAAQLTARQHTAVASNVPHDTNTSWSRLPAGTIHTRSPASLTLPLLPLLLEDEGEFELQSPLLLWPSLPELQMPCCPCNAVGGGSSAIDPCCCLQSTNTRGQGSLAATWPADKVRTHADVGICDMCAMGMRSDNALQPVDSTQEQQGSLRSQEELVACRPFLNNATAETPWGKRSAAVKGSFSMGKPSAAVKADSPLTCQSPAPALVASCIWLWVLGMQRH